MFYKPPSRLEEKLLTADEKTALQRNRSLIFLTAEEESGRELK
jgi:hypothetical protein